MALVIPSIFTAVDKFSAPIRAMSNSVVSFASKSEAAIQRADRSVNKFFSVFNHAQKELLQTLGAAAIAYKTIQAVEFGFDQIKEYDEAITKLQTNFRLSDGALLPFKKGIMEVANESYQSAVEITKIFDVIGSKNRELLKNPEALTAYTHAAINLSEALKTDAIPTAESFINIMAAFDLKDPIKAIDILAGASGSGSLKGLDLANALSTIGVSAKKAHVGLADSAALLELLSDKTALGAEAAPALEKAFLKMEKLGFGYDKAGKFSAELFISNFQKRVAGMKTDYAKNAFAESIFGAKTVDKILPLLAPGALSDLQKYKEKIGESGTAVEMADKNNASLAVSIERVKNAFGNAFIKSDKMTVGMNILNNVLQFVYTHMDEILTVVTLLITGFIAWKALIMATTVITGAYNIALGISSFLQGQSALAVWGNTTALGAFNIAQKAATASAWALDAALEANPILLLIAAVGLLGIGFYEAFKKSENLNDSIAKRNALNEKTTTRATSLEAVEQKQKQFNDANNKLSLNDYLNLIKTDAYKAQLEQFKSQRDAAIKEDNARIAVEDKKNEGVVKTTLPAFNPKLMEQNALVEKSESTQKQTVGLHLSSDSGSKIDVTSNKDNIKITTTSTIGNGL